MLLYSGFLAVFAWALWRETGRRLYLAALALAVVILAADVLENVQLLAISARFLDGADFSAQLDRLTLFTWLKWGGLAAYAVLLVPYFAGRGASGHVMSAVLVLPAVLGALALLSRGLANELMALSIGLVFVLLTVYSLRHGRAPALAAAPGS